MRACVRTCVRACVPSVPSGCLTLETGHMHPHSHQHHPRAPARHEMLQLEKVRSDLRFLCLARTILSHKDEELSHLPARSPPPLLHP